MKIGSTEVVAEPPEEKRKRSQLVGTDKPGGGKGGGNNGGDDGGGDGPEDANKQFREDRPTPEERDETPDKARVIAWFLLLAVLMTFGGLFAAFIVLATNSAFEWQPFELPYPIYLSTGLIIVSSIVYEFGKSELFAGRQISAKKYFVATAALGAIFISSQIMVWLLLVRRGVYFKGNPFAGFFYILTITHVVHVVAGIIALGSVTLRTWIPTANDTVLASRMHLVTAVGWYWHLMGVLWLLIFGLLGYWR